MVPLRQPRLHRVEVQIPGAYLRFPRHEWRNDRFAWPVFAPGDIFFKSVWAGRAASQRWAAAFAASSLAGLDAVDLAVAVFDKASHMCVPVSSMH